MFYNDHEIYHESLDSDSMINSFAVCVRPTATPEGFVETFDSDSIEFDSSDIMNFEEEGFRPSSFPKVFSPTLHQALDFS